MTISYWLDKSSQKKINCDVTVIGAGIAGLSTCYWLLKEDPSLKVVLVDKGTIGAGASGRNAGFVTCGSVEHFNRLQEKHGPEEAGEIWNFSEDNLKLLREHIIQEEAERVLFEQKGSFSLASEKNEFEELKKSAALMAEHGIETEIVEEQQIRERLGAEQFVGGIKYLNDGSVHPVKLLELIHERTKQLNPEFTVLEHNEVHNIETANDGNKIISTSQTTIESSIVITATNAYSETLHPFFKGKVYPTRGQILLTEPIPAFMESPCYANFVLDYFRQLPTGELLIGGFRQLEKETEVGYSDHLTDKIQSALQDFLNKHLPHTREAKITHRWSGVMGFSTDGQPFVGSLPEDPSFYFIAGFTAHGIGLAFHTAKCLVDLMFERKVPGFINSKRFY